MNEKKILVVEDDGVLRDVLVEKLRVSGYSPLGAEDGEVAIQKIKEEKPDMILLDILMPKKDGMEVLEDMSKDDDMKNIPVIVISNSGQPVEIERARSLGAKDFLVKAIFDPNEVLEKVEKILNETSSSEGGTESKEFSVDKGSFSPASAGVSVSNKSIISSSEGDDGTKGKI